MLCETLHIVNPFSLEQIQVVNNLSHTTLCRSENISHTLLKMAHFLHYINSKKFTVCSVISHQKCILLHASISPVDSFKFSFNFLCFHWNYFKLCTQWCVYNRVFVHVTEIEQHLLWTALHGIQPGAYTGFWSGGQLLRA